MNKVKTADHKLMHMDDLHFEHKVWIRQLEFSKDELEIYKNRLGEISQRYTANEILKQVEHFQNQFIIQRHEIDKISHSIHVHEDGLVAEVNSNPVAVNHRLLDDHGQQRERFEMFVNLYDELRVEFMEFLRKWM